MAMMKRVIILIIAIQGNLGTNLDRSRNIVRSNQSVSNLDHSNVGTSGK